MRSGTDFAVAAAMDRTLTYFIVALLITALHSTGVAQQISFPSLEAETSDGTKVTLPRSNGARWTLVGIAYSQKASPLLEEWYEPAYLRFIAKHGLFAGGYDVDVYFVPLFTGVNKAAYEPSMRKFRKSASPEIVDHVLFSKAELEPIKAALGMTDKDIPYFFLLDAQGKVVHRTQGGFTDEKLEAIEDLLMD